MSEQEPCRSCGLQNAPGRDFCERCGEYLSWAATAYVAVPAAGVADEAEAGEDIPDALVDTGAPAAPHVHPPGTPHVHPPAAPPPPAEPPPAEPPSAEPPPAGPVLGQPPPAGPSGGEPPPGASTVPAMGGIDPDVWLPPTESMPAAPPAGPIMPETVEVAAPPPATGDASIVLAAADPAVGAAGVPAVDTGTTLSFVATVRNESQIVDNYDLAVLGLPDGWAIVSPAAAFLVPLGSGRGQSDQEVRIDITAPREYRSTAGIWTFELVALSRTHATIAARAIAQFELRPFETWSVEIVPVVNAGRLKARYRPAVRNDGNAEQMVWLIALPDSGRVRARFETGHLTLQPGEVGVDIMSVRPRFPLPVGRTIEHRIGVDAVPTAPEVGDAEASLSVKEKLAARAKQEAKKTAQGVKVGPKGITLPKPRLPQIKNPFAKFKLDQSALAHLRGPGDAAAPATARQVVFRQRPIIPLWLIGLLLLIAIAAFVIYTLLPDRTSVPALVSEETDAFDAEKLLRKQGLKLSQPVQRRPAPDKPAGSVIEQTPEPGSKVDVGSSVGIVVAAGEAVQVPRLKGRTRVEADKRLRAVDLMLGEIEPADAPDNFVVRSQIPDAGLSVPGGTAVRIFLAKPPATAKQKRAAKKDGDKKKAGGAKAKAGGGGGGGGGGAKAKGKGNQITIPAIADKPVGAYAAGLRKLGLKPNIVSVIATPANKVLAVVPKPGKKAKKGATVTVRAALGMPPLAVQTRRFVLLLDPKGGKELSRLPGGQGSAAEPAYLPGGKRIVYRAARTRLVLARTGKKPMPRRIYDGPDVLTHPSVGSDSNTIAVIRREEGDGDLCIGRLSDADLGHLCLPDDGWDLNGRISWRKDGRALLVPARRRGDRSVFGIRRYTASRRFARDPELWRGRTVTNTKTRGKGVIAAAYSPAGTKVAVVANFETPHFEAVLANANDLLLDEPKATGAKACDVAWRPDAAELAVVQADDQCAEPLGVVARFAVASPAKTVVVKQGGTNPTYAPLK